jgi:iron complex outermembrane receptor protein
MKSFLLSLTVLLLAGLCPALAQPTLIKGMIRDSADRGIENVTVSLHASYDSSLVKASLSGNDGTFELKTDGKGIFFLQYSASGFHHLRSGNFELVPGQDFTAKEVILQTATKQLEGVQVSAQRSSMQMQPGRLVFNVQSSISSTGSNGLELLQKCPGVVVDNQENIILKGKTGIRIYVDEKPLPFTGEELAAYLKSLNSNDIQAIEIITAPGAQFDASGSAGVINLRLKKNQQLGTNGSVTAGLVQGLTPKLNAALNVNHRNRTLNVFANASASSGRNRQDIIAPRTQKDTTYDQRLLQINETTTYSVKAGIDFFINRKNTIGLMNSTIFSIDDYSSEGRTWIYYKPDGRLIKSLLATNTIPKERLTSNTNINYRYSNAQGTSFSADLDKGLYRGKAESYQPNFYIDKNGNLLSAVITYNNTPTDIDIHTAKADAGFVSGKASLGLGIKFSDVRTDNTLDFFNDENGARRPVNERSYRFNYQEKVSAAYATFRRPLGKSWNLEAGIRLEHTASEGLLTRADGVQQQDNDVKRKYLDLFPSALLEWKISEQSQLQAGYSKRIDRPNYKGLNPFEMKLDELSYVKGNSFLKPQYTDHIEVTYTWKHRINVVAGFSHIRDLTTQTVDTFRNYTYAYTKNLASQSIGSFTVSAPVTITRWWNIFVNGWINRQVYKGPVNGQSLQLKATTFGTYLQQSFTPGNDFTAEITSWYNGPTPLGPTLIGRSLGAVDLGIQKTVFGKKGTIRIAVTDVFQTSIPIRAKTDFGGLLLDFEVRRESRTGRISFTYRFGSSKLKEAKQRATGLESESKRIVEN